MKEQLKKQFGEALDIPIDEDKADVSKVELLPFKDFPELGLKLARLTRDVKVQEAVFTLLTQQYEESKIAEAEDTPNVQVLDKAYPAERKSKPRILLSLAMAAFSSLFFGIFLALGMEYTNKLKLEYSKRLASNADKAEEHSAPEIKSIKNTEIHHQS